MITPWGKATEILYGNRSKTIAFVWAEYGKGFMFIDPPEDVWDQEHCYQFNDRWWIDGMMEK